MSLWRQLTRGLRNLTHRAQADRDIADEVEHYLQEATATLEASGLTPEDARRAARLELGGIAAVRQQVRGYGWENIVDSTLDDCRYGFRRLRRSPVFAAVGAMTLALGIGASVAIFSALNPLLFRSLPYPGAGRLMMIWDGQNGTMTDVTFGTYREVLERSRVFEAVAGLLVGALPALHGSRGELQGAVQRRSTRIAGGSGRTRGTLVVVQVALAVVLLVGAGLLVRSLQHLLAVPPGFEPAHLLTMQVQTAGARFRDPDTTHRFFDQVLEAVRLVPGVSAAAFTSQLPLTGEVDVFGVHFQSIPASAADENREGYRYAVSPGYFETMGIPLRQGRVLGVYDDARAPGAAVINESFARRRLPGVDPIGQRLRVGPNTGPWLTVVGVVGDVKQTSLAVTRADAIYVTAAQWTRFADGARWAGRSGAGGRRCADASRQERDLVGR